MQVKKFEAKTMKEALELVKVHLGPEAIILSAKDSHSGFGLMGQKSVEVTAAVSDEVLRKKKIAEARMREELREKFQRIPASKQKRYIEKAFQEYDQERREKVSATVSREPVAAELRAQVKGMRYIDIDDEPAAPTPHPVSAKDRVRRAAQRARQASAEVMTEPRRQPAPQAPPRPPPEPVAPVPNEQVRMLENQVAELRALVDRFQKIPQIPMTMHPGADLGLPFELSGIYQRLTGQGVDPSIAANILRRAQRELDRESLGKPALVDAWAVRHLLGQVEVQSQPYASRYHVFLGTTGQGKTTSLVKFAARLVLREKRTIAIVSLDTQKIGASDQLRIFAQILNVPFAVVRDPAEWAVAEQKLKNVQHILVDPPGLTLATAGDQEWLRRMLPPAEYGRALHYVQSVLARDEETVEIAGRYQALGFHDVIFTRLDEASRHGLLINFQDRFKVPIHSFGTGTRIPEDFEPATKERVVDLLFKLSRGVKREAAL